MSWATLKLTDCPEGLNMEVLYEGGHNPLSPAHIHIEALIGKMAELAEPIGEPIHLNAEQVAEMQANKLLTAKGAPDLEPLSAKDENAAGFAKLRAATEAVASAPDGICPGCSMTRAECADGGDSPTRCLSRNFGLTYEQAAVLVPETQG